MQTRSSRSIVTFARGFSMSGYPDELPPGTYEVIVEEEPLLGLTFQAYWRTATYLSVAGTGGSVALRPISVDELERAIERDRAGIDSLNPRAAAPSPPEDLT